MNATLAEDKSESLDSASAPDFGSQVRNKQRNVCSEAATVFSNDRFTISIPSFHYRLCNYWRTHSTLT